MGEKGFVMLALILFFALTLLAGVGYFYFIDNNSHAPQNTYLKLPNPTLSEINDVNQFREISYYSPGNLKNVDFQRDEATTSIYTSSEYGFSIKFPSYVKERTCLYWNTASSTNPEPLEEVSQRYYEDLAENSVYISAASMAQPKFSGVSEYGRDLYIKDSCIDVPNDINLIKYGYDTGKEENELLDEYNLNIERPHSLKVSYARVSSDDDLLALAHESMAPYEQGCVIKARNTIEGKEGLYEIILADKDGNTLVDQDCFLNYVFNFLYYEPTGVAIISSGRQEAAFYSTNDQFEPEYVFYNQ